MKKRKQAIALITAGMILGNTVPAFAYRPKITGNVLSTDIIAYVDNIPIHSYNYQNHTYVMAEELRDCGFDVVWNGKNRTLNITLPQKRTEKEMSYGDRDRFVSSARAETPGKKRFDVYQTDIQVLFDGKPIQTEEHAKTSVNVNGNTLVLFSALKHFGDVKWDQEYRSSSLHTVGKICTTDFGLQYEETEYIPPQNFVCNLPDGVMIFFDPASRQGMTWDEQKPYEIGRIGGVNIQQWENHADDDILYVRIDKEFLDILKMNCTQPEQNKLQFKSALNEDFVGMAGGDSLPVGDRVFYKTNLSLYQDGKQTEEQDAPIFLSMDHELYIKASALEDAFGMKINNAPEFSDWRWDIVFTKE